MALGTSRKKPLLLVIEDDADLAELVRVGLEAAKFTVVAANNGQVALSLLDVLTPDVILSDVSMPVLDGFGFLRAYHQRPGRHVPVVLMSAFAPFVQEAEKAGAVSGLTKPFQLPQLARMLGSAIQGEKPAPLVPAEPDVERERFRLRSVLDLSLDQPAPEAELSRYTEWVAEHFGVKTCLISIITSDRQYWTAGCRMPSAYESERGSHRNDSFCTHAVAARAALIVQDAAHHLFFRDNVFVREHGVQFYAGVPLFARFGEALGTLCLLDERPRTFTHFDLELLSVLARRIVAAIEVRETQLHPELPRSVFRYLDYYDRDLEVFGRAAFGELAIVEGARAVERAESLALVGIAIPKATMREVARALEAANGRALIGRLGSASLGWLVPGAPLAPLERVANELAGPFGRVAAVQLERFPGAFDAALCAVESAIADAGR